MAKRLGIQLSGKASLPELKEIFFDAINAREDFKGKLIITLHDQSNEYEETTLGEYLINAIGRLIDTAVFLYQFSSEGEVKAIQDGETYFLGYGYMGKIYLIDEFFILGTELSKNLTEAVLHEALEAVTPFSENEEENLAIHRAIIEQIQQKFFDRDSLRVASREYIDRQSSKTEGSKELEKIKDFILSHPLLVHLNPRRVEVSEQEETLTFFIENPTAKQGMEEGLEINIYPNDVIKGESEQYVVVSIQEVKRKKNAVVPEFESDLYLNSQVTSNQLSNVLYEALEQGKVKSYLIMLANLRMPEYAVQQRDHIGIMLSNKRVISLVDSQGNEKWSGTSTEVLDRLYAGNLEVAKGIRLEVGDRFVAKPSEVDLDIYNQVEQYVRNHPILSVLSPQIRFFDSGLMRVSFDYTKDEVIGLEIAKDRRNPQLYHIYVDLAVRSDREVRTSRSLVTKSALPSEFITRIEEALNDETVRLKLEYRAKQKTDQVLLKQI